MILTYYPRQCSRFRSTLSILMVIVMLLSSFTRLGILIDFKINQDFIAKVLCINKDTSMTICNGKCYLSKRLKEADEQEQSRFPKNIKDKIEIIFFSHFADTNILNFNLPCEKKSFNKYQPHFHNSSFISNIFRPPKL